MMTYKDLAEGPLDDLSRDYFNNFGGKFLFEPDHD
jgi:hypothetical protein